MALGKQWLVAELRKQGFDKKKAKEAVDAVFEIWSRTLARHETIELPVGWIQVRRERRRDRRNWTGEKILRHHRRIFQLWTTYKRDTQTFRD